jgi:hypothetical protein
MRVHLTTELKTRITADWSSCFPGLGVYEPMHLLRRVGPLLIGISLERDSGNDSYRPTFHVHNLAKALGHITLTLYQPLLTERTRAPDTIFARWHTEMFWEAAKRLESQAPLPLSGNVLLEEVIEAYRSRLKSDGCQFDNCLFEDMALISTCLERTDTALLIVNEARLAMSAWPDYALAKIGNPDDWKDAMMLQVADPEGVRTTVHRQIELLGVQNLPTSDLLLVPL